MAALDLLDWPADQALRISGAPASLRVPVMLRNATAEPQGAGQAVLVEVKAASGAMLPVRSISTGPIVAAESTALGQFRMRLDPATPPGRYEGRIIVAGVARSIQIDVIEHVELSIRPEPLAIDLAKGLSQRATAAFENRGNVPLTIDLAGTYPLGEEIPVFPERLQPAPTDGLERLADLFSRTIGARAPRALREAGTIAIDMPEGSTVIDPGTTSTITLGVKLPGGLSPTARYRAFIPVYAADLDLVIVTATKPTPKARPPSKGAAS